MTRKKLALIVAVVIFAAGTASFSLDLERSETSPSVTLGAEWQCYSTAGILTTCTRIRQDEPAADSSRQEQPCVRRA